MSLTQDEVSRSIVWVEDSNGASQTNAYGFINE